MLQRWRALCSVSRTAFYSPDLPTAFKMPYYAVAIGRNTGVFHSWPECETQVKGYPGAKFKKFPTENEARTFISENGGKFPKSNGVFFQKRSFKTRTAAFHQRNESAPHSNKKFDRFKLTHDDEDCEVICISDDDADTDDEFERLDGFDDEISTIMDQLEDTQNTGDKSVKKKKRNGRSTILLDSVPHQRGSLKRVGNHVSLADSKKAKPNIVDGFMIDESGYVEVYTDGACSMNGSKYAQAGLGVYFGENHPLNVSEPVSGRATNNCGEIQAATKAILVAHSKGVKKLVVKTDSQFVINSVTKWIEGWKRKGWKLASGEPVKNEIDFKDLDKALNLVDVKWVYVEAHKGILGNERADQLAKEGAARYKRVYQ